LDDVQTEMEEMKKPLPGLPTWNWNKKKKVNTVNRLNKKKLREKIKLTKKGKVVKKKKN
jgi:hypothetical protein